MIRDKGCDVHVGQRIAVDDEKGGGVEKRKRMSRAAGGAQDRHLPRITYAQAVSGAVADDARDRLRQMMKVQNRVGNAGAGQPPEDPLDEWLAGHGHGSLRADE